jgi:hypothetical protein
MPEHPYLQWPVFRRSVVAAFQRSLTGQRTASSLRPRGGAAKNAHDCRFSVTHVLAGQNVGVTEVGERIWLVTFMHYDLGYFDDEVGRLEPIANPFGPKVLPMCSE